MLVTRHVMLRLPSASRGHIHYLWGERIISYLDIEVIITKDLYTQLQDFQADRVAEDGDTAQLEKRNVNKDQEFILRATIKSMKWSRHNSCHALIMVMTWHSNTPESWRDTFLIVRLQVSSPPLSSSLLAVYLSEDKMSQYQEWIVFTCCHWCRCRSPQPESVSGPPSANSPLY